jgi:hypothetical protein
MKAFVFIPNEYTIGQMIVEGFEENGWDAEIIDFKDHIPEWKNSLFVKTIGFPDRLNKAFQSNYFELINRKYIELIENGRPDVIVIYNNQYFSPETLTKIRNKTKITFFLGDNPLWSNTSDTNLTILKYSNYTILPDTYWKNELESIDIPNVNFDMIGYSKKYNFKLKNISESDRLRYSNDLVFVGRNYKDSAGYKRSLFYSQFSEMDLKIYGSHGWDKWTNYFPELNGKIQHLNERITHEKLNLILNCCKVYPIDQNPGIINGLHARVFEAIGSEILPVLEYRSDVDIIFNEVRIPVIRKYSEGQSIAKYYIENEQERDKLICELKEYIDSNYLPINCIAKLIKNLN